MITMLFAIWVSKIIQLSPLQKNLATQAGINSAIRNASHHCRKNLNCNQHMQGRI